MATPAIRASWSKRILARIEALGERSNAPAITLDPAVAERIRSRGRIGWVDIADHISMLESCRFALGEREYVVFYRNSVATDLADSVVGAITRGGLRLFGAGPLGLAKVLPRAWSYITRDCGEFTVVNRPDGGTIVTVTALPEVLQRTDTYALTIRGMLEACFDFGRVEGTVSATAIDPGADGFRYLLELSGRG